MTIALFGKSIRAKDAAYITDLIRSITERGGRVLVWSELYGELISSRELGLEQKAVLSEPCCKPFFGKLTKYDQVDMLFSLGGDGTLLDTLSVCVEGGIPVLGANLGHLGFLTSVGRADLGELMDNIEQRRYKTERHFLLSAHAEGLTEELFAINEVCLRSLSPSELLEIEAYVDGEYLSTYSSDGLIAATPTGSTAYSMSCGGPIISPSSKCICLTPISPHNLTHRPLILPETSEIEFRILRSKSRVSLHLDSQSLSLNPPSKITIRKADAALQLVRMENRSFFSAIRDKLMWGKNLRNAENEWEKEKE